MFTRSRSPSSTFSLSPPLASFSSFGTEDIDPFAVPPVATPVKVKGSYCFYTKKKNEVEAAHQEEAVRMVMLILRNWLTQPPVHAHSTRRFSLSTSPEQLFLNAILTVLPLTHFAPATRPLEVNNGDIWRELAERAYAELAESNVTLVQGTEKDISRAVLIALHGMKLPDWAHPLWTRGRASVMDSRLMLSETGPRKSGRKFDVVISGGGPVGLTVATLLAHSVASSTTPAALPTLRIRIFDQRWICIDGLMRWRDATDPQANTRRRQVITLQDYVVSLLDEGYKSAVGMGWSDIVWPDKADIGIDTRRGAERVYVNSRQAPIRDVEDRLLAELRDNPLIASMIELVPASFTQMRETVDLFIGADGASGKAFTVNHKEGDKLVFEREVLEAHQTDRALGIPINCIPTATQAEIVFLTLCQTIYLLNSTSNGLGFLNIRLPSDLYDALAALSPAQRTFSALLDSPNPLHTRVVALIDAGFRLYGMDVSKVLDERIDVFRLSLASAPKTVKWVKRDPSKGREGGEFPMVVVGDAAMQHNFWPGRGANSGLLAAWALSATVLRSFEVPNFRGLVDAHLAPYEGFMRSLKVREHDGRGRFIQMIDIERIYAQAFPASSQPLDILQSARDRLTARAILCRDRLGTRPEFTSIHPIPVAESALKSAITRMCGTAFSVVTRNTPMAIMDSAILCLLEGSQQWPTSEMNPLGYDLSPKGFIQPSYEDVALSLAKDSSSRLSLPVMPSLKSRRASWSGQPTPAPAQIELAIDTDPAFLALALLDVKPDIKAWGDVARAGEKAYKKAMKGGFGSKFQKIHDRAW